MDRFIPSESSLKTYKSHVSARRSMPDLRYIGSLEDQIASLSFGQDHTNRRVVSTAGDVLDSSPCPPTPPYKGLVAEALGFSVNDRVLQFQGSSPTSSDASHGSAETSGPFLAAFTPKKVALYLASSPKSREARKKRPVKNIIPYKVLDAPGLRNDFYSNLVSWSPNTGVVSVGLGSYVYLCSDKNRGGIALPLDEFDVITCLSFSEGDLLLIGTKHGKVVVYSQEFRVVVCDCQFVEKGIFSMCWMPGSNEEFYVGNESGEVIRIWIDFRGTVPELRIRGTIRSNEQQICGIYTENLWALVASY